MIYRYSRGTFKTWANDPACPEFFFKTKGKFLVSASDETGGDGDLTDNQKDTVKRVLSYYGPHDAQWLSQLTHMEDPWIKARAGVPAGAPCSNIITKESMALYYGGLRYGIAKALVLYSSPKSRWYRLFSRQFFFVPFYA